MKKLLIGLIAIYGLSLLVFEHKIEKQSNQKLTPVEKVDISKTISKSIKPQETLSSQQDIEGALTMVEPMESHLEKFKNMTKKDLQNELGRTETYLNKGQFFQKANSEEGLTAVEAKELTALLRKRQALNLVILEKNLEKMEREYL